MKVTCDKCHGIFSENYLKQHQKTIKCEASVFMDELKYKNYTLFREQGRDECRQFGYMFYRFDELHAEAPNIADLAIKSKFSIFYNWQMDKPYLSNGKKLENNNNEVYYYIPECIYHIVMRGAFFWEKQYDKWDWNICLDILKEIDKNTELRNLLEGIWRLAGREAMYTYMTEIYKKEAKNE